MICRKGVCAHFQYGIKHNLLQSHQVAQFISCWKTISDRSVLDHHTQLNISSRGVEVQFLLADFTFFCFAFPVFVLSSNFFFSFCYLLSTHFDEGNSHPGAGEEGPCISRWILSSEKKMYNYLRSVHTTPQLRSVAAQHYPEIAK